MPRRRPDDGLVSGVAAGLAGAWRLDVTLVRAAFVVLAVLGGAGIPFYLGAHLLMPDDQGRPTETSTARAALLFAAGLVGVAVVRAVGLVPLSGLSVPLAIAVIGTALLWREVRSTDGSEAPPAHEVVARLVGDDRHVRDGRTRRLRLLRGTVAVALVLAGIGGSLAVNGDAADLGPGLGAALVTVIGVVLLSAPWWWRLATEATAERRARVRSEERAEMAAHLHDSVLQTLTLIQRHPERATDVARLARRQERELRAWLHDPDRPLRGTLADGLRRVAHEIEDDHEIVVELVVVGDAPLDEAGGAVVMAAGEALRNAALHAGVEAVSVFAEIDAGGAEVFVRDRGRGFDPGAVDAGRRGIADSIRGRMRRLGGDATVRSQIGAGTEVHLRVPVGGTT